MNLNKAIQAKGFYEQENQYLFPALYGNKAVTKQTIGMYKHFDREIKKRDKIEQRINKLYPSYKWY